MYLYCGILNNFKMTTKVDDLEQTTKLDVLLQF